MELTYHLGVSCVGKTLSYDFCKSDNILKNTFMEVYSHYIGRKPRGNTVAKFLDKSTVVAHNGLEYVFWYDAN